MIASEVLCVVERRRYRIAASASAAAVLLTHYVTMRTVYSEWGTPAFGFPLPAFGYTGTSSGQVWFAPLPLALDLLAALALAVPATLAVDRLLPPRLVWAFAALGWLITAFDVAPLSVIGWYGDVEVRRWPTRATWPVECRTPWIGPVQPWLDDEDLDDPCVRRQQRAHPRDP